MALGFSIVALPLDYTYISQEVCVCAHMSCVYLRVHHSPWVYVHRWLGWHQHGHFQTDTDAAFPIKVKIERNRGH